MAVNVKKKKPLKKTATGRNKKDVKKDQAVSREERNSLRQIGKLECVKAFHEVFVEKGVSLNEMINNKELSSVQRGFAAMALKFELSGDPKIAEIIMGRFNIQTKAQNVTHDVGKETYTDFLNAINKSLMLKKG